MVGIKVGGRVWPLAFTLDAMDKLEERTGKTIDQLTFRIKTKEDREALLQTIEVLMAEGARGTGMSTFTAKELRAAMRPGELMAALTTVSDAISEGMAMETEEDEKPGEVDLVLEEIKKKEKPDG